MQHTTYHRQRTFCSTQHATRKLATCSDGICGAQHATRLRRLQRATMQLATTSAAVAHSGVIGTLLDHAVQWVDCPRVPSSVPQKVSKAIRRSVRVS